MFLLAVGVQAEQTLVVEGAEVAATVDQLLMAAQVVPV
jgi:hypothetical protein